MEEPKVEIKTGPGPEYEIKEIIFSRKYGKDNYGSMGVMLSAVPKTPKIDVLKCLSDLNDACDEYFLISMARAPVEEPTKPKEEPPRPSPFKPVPPPAAAPAPAPKPPVDTGPKRYTIEEAQRLLPEDLEAKMSFEAKGEWIIIKPKQFLGSDNFAKIASQLRGAGGEYISAAKDSHFRLPFKTGQAAAPAQAPAQEHHIRSEEDDASLQRYGFISKNVEKHQDGLLWHIVQKKDSEETYYRASKKDHEQGTEARKFDDLKTKLEGTDNGGAKFGGGFTRWILPNGDIGKKPKGGS